MSGRSSGSLVVRPIERSQVGRFNALLDDHHWLGHRLTGEVMRYAAVEDGRWVALVGFGSAALSCAPRDRHIGWDRQLQFRRLRLIVNNQRFCVLPGGRRPNLASGVLGRALRRVSADYQSAYGHPVLMVETFTDPARHSGTCYAAANFTAVGLTLGYRRSAGRYVHHGQPKLVWLRPLHQRAAAVLAAPFDHPWTVADPTRKAVMIDLNDVDLDGGQGLLARLDALVDPRKARGIRHRMASILAVAAAAVLSGARNFTAIGEWAQEAPQQVLAALGVRRHPRTGLHTAPSEPTLRRALQTVDADALDATLGAWLDEQARTGRIELDRQAVAVDGKSLRGARQSDGRPVHLFSAMTHREGVVLAQREIDHDTGEISGFRPLLEPLDLNGAVVTADALHTQREHADFLVEHKGADYLFTVKGNQPKTLQAVQDLFEQGCFPPVPHPD